MSTFQRVEMPRLVELRLPRLPERAETVIDFPLDPSCRKADAAPVIGSNRFQIRFGLPFEEIPKTSTLQVAILENELGFCTGSGSCEPPSTGHRADM